MYRECETDNEGFIRRDILIQSHDKVYNNYSNTVLLTYHMHRSQNGR